MVLLPLRMSEFMITHSKTQDLPANARDAGLIPGLGRPLGEGNGNPSSILAWKIPWTEDLGRLQSMGVAKESDMT